MDLTLIVIRWGRGIQGFPGHKVKLTRNDMEEDVSPSTASLVLLQMIFRRKRMLHGNGFGACDRQDREDSVVGVKKKLVALCG